MIEILGKPSKPVFEMLSYSNETLILSFLQGHMGRGWTNDLQSPACVQILVGDFCFFAGSHESKQAISLIENIPPEYKSPFLLAIPQNQAWAQLIKSVYGDRSQEFTRYAIKKEPDCFEKSSLEFYINTLPPNFELVGIDNNLYDECMRQDFSKDFCAQFSSADDYAERGMGFCILDNGQIVCGASSYTVYDGGIEIEIATEKEYRRKGLATVCASKLILECLSQNKYPSWDAANKASVALAEKLGYHLDYGYSTIKIDCSAIR